MRDEDKPKSFLRIVMGILKIVVLVIIIITVGFSLLLVIGMGIYTTVKYPKHPLASAFYKSLNEAKKQKINPVYFTDIAPFKWEKVCFLAPYATIESTLGDDYIAEPVLTDDGIFHIAFGLPDKHTVPVRISREFFERNDRKEDCITYGDAKTIPIYLEE